MSRSTNIRNALIASARELRNPLTAGYAALVTFWVLAGEEARAAADQDALGRRLLDALNIIGWAGEFGLYTFIAALAGSLLWRVGLARIVNGLAKLNRHPDWSAFIDEAKDAVRRYEEHQVLTYRGQSGGRPSSFDSRHTVPSPRWAAYLHERVEERERTSAEMSWRITLAVVALPLAVAIGLEGGGLWWAVLAVLPLVWLDVALLKHTTLRTVRRYRLEDLRRRLEEVLQQLQYDEHVPEYGDMNAAAREEQERCRRDQLETTRAEQRKLEEEIAEVTRMESRRSSRIFALVEAGSE